MAEPDIKKYLRLEKFPHIWCPGCGIGIIFQALLRAIAKLDLDKNQIAMVSGIGCSSRAVGYADFCTLHTAHGRSLPFGTGIKLARPEMNVIAFAGDGDITAIGGNHFIHAARRNIDITTIIVNNYNYGMTNGQYSPLTPHGATTTTAPYGNIEYPFDVCKLAEHAGATYVARSTAYHVRQLPELIIKGINNKGFSVIEVISQCPIYFGRRNDMGDSVNMLKWQRDNAINLKQASQMSEEEMEGKFIVGELHHKPKKEYTEEYQNLIERVKNG